MEHLVILDFNTGEVDIYPVEYNVEYDYKLNMEELLKYLGHNIKSCEWMCTKGNITFHKEV